jgi:enoyl-CoA hydratase/carnithine racemase
VLLLSAAGERAFSAGVAVGDHTADKIGAMLDAVHGVARRLRALPAASVAVVRGLCLGGGLELAASCDLVLAAGLERPFDDALAAAETIYTEEIGPSEDLAEGVAAFLAKRSPRWRHR